MPRRMLDGYCCSSREKCFSKRAWGADSFAQNQMRLDAGTEGPTPVPALVA